MFMSEVSAPLYFIKLKVLLNLASGPGLNSSLRPRTWHLSMVQQPSNVMIQKLGEDSPALEEMPGGAGLAACLI